MSIARDYRKTIYGRPATIKAKLSLFDNHIAPFARAQQLEPFVERVVNDWKEHKLSVGTVKMLLTILKDFVKFAWKQDLDTKRVNFQYFGDRVKPQPRIKVWTKDQIKAAMDVAAVDHIELWEVMTVALYMGMRKGEIFALTWEDIDMLAGEVTISKSIDVESGMVGPTKTKQIRTIQMPFAVAKIMEKGYTPGKEGDRCFRTFNPNQQLKALCKKADVPVISFHDLRHTFATTCLERQLSPKWVSETLGHAKLTTTLDIYWQNFKNKVDLEDLYE